ncbi:phage portal protein [Stenotrophomonas pictorum JCM 9942]|uniref:Phage portal protein n=1 Tax=Stenotrophomonas pictorum JCM 9942 TaxID=1236960 RepID=A0A0R0ANP7_9GAMM|nr:phage portal protein [Stenotrophomonas pictorum]KRG43214.1 phage portal protein [Stenotrophomonas pictorum JCM 9942]
MNRLDSAIAAISPGWGARRAHARAKIAAYSSAYDAANPTRLRESARDYGSGNTVVASGSVRIRAQARHLDRNHDIVVNGFNQMVQNVIGRDGIGIEPQPRDANGNIVESLVDQITPLLRDFWKRPEVSWCHDFGAAQRLMARTLFRDGECLYQDLIGPVPYLDHGTIVPYSIEMIEPDLMPLDLNDSTRNIIQGVERNAWGRPVAYHLYKQHPGDPNVLMPQIKRVSADFVHHAKMVDRIGQVRGVSVLASVLTRLDDLKDYEESERVAAKIAASMAAFIIKGDPQSYGENEDKPHGRRMRFQPGMVFDDLVQGESVGTVDTNRPNPNLETYRNGQLRAVAGGMRVSFSSLSKNYNGTYSAQRQELVEQYGAYGVLAYEVISQIVRPIYERFIQAAIASGELVIPAGVSRATVSDAMFMPPVMPWINPVHEATGLRMMIRAGIRSLTSVISERGGRMYDTLEEIRNERAWANELGITLDSDPGQVSDSGVAQSVQADPTLPHVTEDTQ